MAFLEIEYNSKVLEMERHVNVIYPDASEIDPALVEDKDIPVLYLLQINTASSHYSPKMRNHQYM